MADQKKKRKAEAEITASDARIRLSELVNRVRYSGERFVIVRRGKPVAAIIDARDLDMLNSAA